MEKIKFIEVSHIDHLLYDGYNCLMIEGQIEQGDYTPLQSVLNCLKRKEVNTKFPIYLNQFIKTNPPKKEIEEVSNAFLMSKKEGLHYRDLTDLLVIILRLLLNFAHNDQDEDFEKRFIEKFNLFKEKLKRPEVNEWILALRMELINGVKLKGKQKDRRKHKDTYLPEFDLAKDLQKMRVHKDELAKVFQQIALIFYDYSEVERRTRQPDFYRAVVATIQELKENLSQKEQKLSKGLKVAEKLKQLGVRYSIKSLDGIDILKQLDSQIKEQAAKLSFINNRLESSKKNQSEKDDRIASLRIRLEKYDQEIRIQKNRVQHLQAKEQEMLCKNFLGTSQIIQCKKVHQITFLRNTIKDLTDLEGSKCKLLYSSSQTKCRNFHELIDNKPNILLLILLKNGSIIGGFSRQQFRPPRCSGQQGFIFNVNQMEAYERQQRSSISYDDYYLIFGNSEICIKVNDMHVLSNFAIQARHFNSKNRDVAFFLGSSEREAEMKIFEIYQVLTQ